MNEPLAEREIEILRLAADGYANGEIAARLSLSLNTIKWYSRRIYEKLAVDNRTQAVQRAQALGLLEENQQPAKPTQSFYNLPNPLTALVGRRTEVDAVKQLLKQNRLLTLTGPGGIGKTRLALQVAAEMSGFFPSGVCFVELAAIQEPEQVLNTIAHLLSPLESLNSPLLTQIQVALHDKQFLLILDNFEHLLDAAPVVVDLLTACPKLTVLVTSREVLALYGEQEYAVPPLQLPDLEWFATNHLASTTLLTSEALQLFEHCAQAVSPNFRLTAENTQAVASICLRLDGLPLAIELAAAYVKIFAPQAMLTQLDSLWLEMKRSLRNIPERQQTLRNTIEWSYRFLNEEERRLFAQLAVFRGGCTWAAIHAICSSDTPERSSAALLEPLNGLINKSLVWRRTDGEGEPRFGMLETIREYATSCLQIQGEVDLLQERHASYFLALAEEAAPQLIGAQQQTWLPRLETEHPNLRAALQHLLTKPDGEQALRLATALHRFWEYRGYVGEGQAWLRQALTKCATTNMATSAKALTAAGSLAYRQGNLDQARHDFTESLRLFEQTAEGIGIADALQFLGRIDTNQGNYAAAQQRLEQSLTLARTLNYEHGIAAALQSLGGLAWDQDRFTEAREYYRESLDLLQRLGHKVSIASTSLNLGNTERMLNNVDAAHTYFEAALEIAQGLGHQGLIGASFKNLSLLAFRQQDYAQARRYGEEALRIFREVGDKSHIAFALSNLGSVALKFREYRQALSYWAEDLQIMHEIGYKWPIFEALEDIAGLLTEVGQHTEYAVRLLGAADSLRQETGIPIAPYQESRRLLATTLHQRVDDATFQGRWTEGQTTPLAQIVADVLTLSLEIEPA